MKSRCCLFAILALGALSSNAALAGPPSHASSTSNGGFSALAKITPPRPLAGAIPQHPMGSVAKPAVVAPSAAPPVASLPSGANQNAGHGPVNASVSAASTATGAAIPGPKPTGPVASAPVSAPPVAAPPIPTPPIPVPASAAMQTIHGASGAPPVAVATTNASSISGTGLVRPGSSPPVVGGSAKPTKAAAISGNSVPVKHP
jgi:hypothetical protein